MSRYISSPTTSNFVESQFGIRDVWSGFGNNCYCFFTSSTSWTAPADVNCVRVTVLGAGGGSGPITCLHCCNEGERCQFYGGGGGGGAYVVAYSPVTPSGTYCIVVGAGGSNCNPLLSCCWCTTSCFYGGVGGVSKFGTCICANGGCGGRWTGICGGNCAIGGTGGGYVIAGGAVTTIRAVCGNCGCAGYLGRCRWTASNSTCPLSCYEYPSSIPGNYTQFPYMAWLRPMHSGEGGASGSPLGQGTIGPFPGPTGSDIFGCKNYLGEDISDIATLIKLSGSPYTINSCGCATRWPGEAIISTSRNSSSVVGTATTNCDYKYPYKVAAYGGARNTLDVCMSETNGMNIHAAGAAEDMRGDGTHKKMWDSCFYNAGCGGGGSYSAIYCYSCRVCVGKTFCLGCYCHVCSNNSAGNGFVVVEW